MISIEKCTDFCIKRVFNTFFRNNNFWGTIYVNEMKVHLNLAKYICLADVGDSNVSKAYHSLAKWSDIRIYTGLTFHCHMYCLHVTRYKLHVKRILLPS